MNRLLAILATLAVLVKVATAQVPFAQTGRALDVNPASGNWQANTLRRQAGPSGNLYVTGQVTQGFSFRRPSPYSGVNELSLTLPSEGLDNFTRDSMGLQNLQTGRSYRPQAYTPPSRQVAILRGRTPPMGADTDSRALGSLSQPTLTLESVPRTALPSLAPILSSEVMASMLSQSTSRGGVPTPTTTAVAGTDTAGRPGVSALFGFIEAAEREKLAEQLAEPEPAPEPAEDAPLPAETDPEVDEEPSQSILPVEPSDRAAPGDQPWGSGEDVFVDVLVELNRKRQLPTSASVTGAPPADASLERLDVDPSERVNARRDRGALASATTDPFAVRQLGGQRDDRFNRLMAEGDKRMARGQFYQAAARYESARVVYPLNPLAPLGAGLAYLGAGETYRASHYLRVSVKMFAEMRKVRIDIDHLLGADVVDGRLAQVRQALSDSPTRQEMPLVFLAAYIYANRGQVDQARQWAETLKPLVVDDPRLTAYAEYLVNPAGSASPADEGKP